MRRKPAFRRQLHKRAAHPRLDHALTVLWHMAYCFNRTRLQHSHLQLHACAGPTSRALGQTLEGCVSHDGHFTNLT
eukprot:4033397-Amphidinium_carterae.1